MADSIHSVPPVATNSNGPAVVQWVSDGKTQCLGLQHPEKVHFHLNFDATSKTAFFKLRIPVVLESSPESSTPLFIFIYPERIKSLTQIEDDTSGELLKHIVKNKQGTGTILHLRFELSKPADLVLPKTLAGKTIEKNALHGIATSGIPSLLMILARTTVFDICVHLISVKDSLAKGVAPVLCQAASSHILTSNGPSADLVSLYGGKGGQVFDLADVESPAPVYDESPPAYNDEPVPTSAAVVQVNSIGKAPEAVNNGESKKRRRSLSPGDSVSEKHRHSIEDVFSRLFKEAMLAMESRLESRIHNWIEGRLKEQADEVRSMESRMKEWLEDRLRQQAEEFQNLEEGQERMRNEFDDQIQQVRDETDDLCDVRIDDQMLSVKVECEEFVKEEMREAKRGIIQHFRRMADLFSDIDSELGEDNG